MALPNNEPDFNLLLPQLNTTLANYRIKLEAYLRDRKHQGHDYAHWMSIWFGTPATQAATALEIEKYSNANVFKRWWLRRTTNIELQIKLNSISTVMSYAGNLQGLITKLDELENSLSWFSSLKWELMMMKIFGQSFGKFIEEIGDKLASCLTKPKLAGIELQAVARPPVAPALPPQPAADMQYAVALHQPASTPLIPQPRALLVADRAEADKKANVPAPRLPIIYSNHKHCELLELPGLDFSQAEVVKAFRKKALLVHPDRLKGKSEAEQLEGAAKFKDLSNAATALIKLFNPNDSLESYTSSDDDNDLWGLPKFLHAQLAKQREQAAKEQAERDARYERELAAQKAQYEKEAAERTTRREREAAERVAPLKAMLAEHSQNLSVEKKEMAALTAKFQVMCQQLSHQAPELLASFPLSDTHSTTDEKTNLANQSVITSDAKTDAKSSAIPIPTVYPNSASFHASHPAATPPKATSCAAEMSKDQPLTAPQVSVY